MKRAAWVALAGWAFAACVSVPFEAPPGPGAGAGSLAVEPDRMEASQEVRLRFTFSPGPAGVVQGGGFGVRLPQDPVHPHLGFTPPHAGARHLRGHIRCLSERAGGAKDPVEETAVAPGGGWAQCLLSRGKLEPGGKLLLDYWGLAPRVAGDFALAAASRVTGGRGASPVEGMPGIRVMARPARVLGAVLPSEAEPGRNVVLALVALDEFGNRARSYGGTVRVRLDDLDLEHEFLAAEQGVALEEIRAPSRPGFAWASVSELDEPEGLALRARSNPMRVVDPDRPAGASRGRILWGDPHAPIRAEERPEAALSYARDVSRLDFAGIVAAGPAARGGADLWERCGRAVRAAAPDGLIPLAGFAWNDAVVLASDPEAAPVWPDLRATDEPSELLAAIETGPLAGSIPVVGSGAGSWGSRGAFEIYSWRNRDALLQDHPRRFEPGDASVPAPACFVAGSAGSWGRPGLVSRTGLEPGAGGLTAVRARGEAPGELLRALAAGQAWATTGPRIYLDVRVRGAEVSLAAAGSAPLRSVGMVTVSREGRRRVELLDEPAGVLVTTLEAPHGDPGGYYWFHVVQDDDEMAWSGPWRMRAPPAGREGT